MSDKKPYKSDLKGLLRFLMDHTKKEDAPDSMYQEMDAEKRKFLESALNCMTTDVITEFEKAISVLEDPTSEVTAKVNALNIIRENIDDIDFANSFIKAGGSVYLIEILSDSDCELKCLAAYIVAEMSQNNPFCQKYFVDSKTIPKLVNFLHEQEDVACSGLHAISSLLQNFEPGVVEFLNVNGIRGLLTCLCTNTNSRLFVRACFLMGKLAENAIIRDELAEKSVVAKLIECLPENSVNYNIGLEANLSALRELSKSNKWVIDKDQEKKLKSLLTNIVEYKTEPEFQEICEYSKAIVQQLDSEL
ncbi:uncharacterized protein [Eurosta solidaginis]|uniref:uncharacterized protein n=1 Tax=Eurosta solidaginis TaxID=178769 RepID=UPI00353107E3